MFDEKCLCQNLSKTDMTNNKMEPRRTQLLFHFCFCLARICLTLQFNEALTSEPPVATFDISLEDSN